MTPAPRVVIIGAGISGLTAAWELSRQGCAVRVLEQHDVIGGLARSLQLGGAPIERYYHFICANDVHLKNLAAELGVLDRLHWRPSKTSYFVAGRLYPFTTPTDILRFSPISLLSRIRFGLHSAYARRFTNWPAIEHLSAREWLVRGMGQEAYEVIWRPLLHMKFGPDLDRVSAPWMWHRIHRVSTSRRSLLRPEELATFEGGSFTLLTALAEETKKRGGSIELGCPVRRLLHSGGRITGVETDAEEIPADAVISTVPLPALRPLLPPWAENYSRELGRIEYVGVVCLLARVARPLTDCFWINVNDERVPFNGIVEYTNLSCWRNIGGSDVFYIPLYMAHNDPRFLRPDEELVAELLAGVATLFPDFHRSQVLETVVTRDCYAQAICPPGFSRQVPAAATPLPGLFLTDSTQLYPADRNLSGTIRLARQASSLCLDWLRR